MNSIEHQRRNRTQYSVLSIWYAVVCCPILVHAAAQSARAGESCCCSCGCAAPSQKICRLECGEKKVEVICWGCKKEDFCVACRSEQGCKHCQTVCENCDNKEVCAKSKRFVWFDWIPGTATIHTRTKLMRKAETVTVPSYKWVVEDMCPQCAANAAAANPGTIVYAAPVEPTPATGEEGGSIFSLVRLPKLMAK